ncbi:MAG: hypothetical protein IMW89_19485 [Ktedonobacteraceae bacterium]|nr:hypothetical protein [Ktedonobacteraceae bacterium]
MMRITARDYQTLQRNWLPQIEIQAGTQECCPLCRRQHRQLWRDLCQDCTQREYMREDERIRTLDDHGFVTECIHGCPDPHVAVWIIGCDYYHFWSDEKGQHYVCMTEERSVLCEACIQRALTQPSLYQDCILWMRNIRLIRKVREGRTDVLHREVADLLVCLE